MGKARVKLVFTPSGKKGDFPRGTSLLDAARQLGVDLDSVCGGRGLCGRCQVLPVAGAFPKHRLESAPEHLTAFSAAEARYEQRKGKLAPGRRLGCHACLEGDLVIDVPPESQVHQQVIRKEVDVQGLRLAPSLHLHAVSVKPPELDAPSGDLERLMEALAREWGLAVTSVHPALLAGLQETLRQGDWFVTAALDAGSQLRWLWPGLKEDLYGVAMDLGTTTVAGHLCHLASGQIAASASLMNPQIRFGEDLMSRVSYLMMHPGEAGELTRVIREALNGLLADLAEAAGVKAEEVLDITLVANPIMHHLFLGLSPVHLGGAPFALAASRALLLPARDLGLAAANPAANVYALPCIAGHVGADAAGMALAEAPWASKALTLLVDVGTNAEIILGNSERLLACSSPTGPAFEGAEISCGQRAAPGAIERVRIDRKTLEPRFKLIGTDAWSDAPGFAAEPTGLCGSGIIDAIAEMYLAGIISAEGVIQGSLASRTERLVQQGRTWAYALHQGQPELLVTQQDVRQIQLAKAALHAGIKLLMQRYGATSLDRIRLAGAFGSHLDTARALAIGLVPDCPLESISAAGNAAGTGALLALLNFEARAEIEARVQSIEKIETATEPAFQSEFVAAMNFPHSQDAYPHLFAHFPKPTPTHQARRTKR